MSAGANVTSSGFKSGEPTIAPDRAWVIAEATWLITTTGFCGWVGEQTGPTSDYAFGGALVGLVAGYCVWRKVMG